MTKDELVIRLLEKYAKNKELEVKLEKATKSESKETIKYHEGIAFGYEFSADLLKIALKEEG